MDLAAKAAANLNIPVGLQGPNRVAYLALTDEQKARFRYLYIACGRFTRDCFEEVAKLVPTEPPAEPWNGGTFGRPARGKLDPESYRLRFQRIRRALKREENYTTPRADALLDVAIRLHLTTDTDPLNLRSALDCPECRGTGRVTYTGSSYEHGSRDYPCDKCDGVGTRKPVCRYCDSGIEFEGDRWVSTEEGGTYDHCVVNTGDPTEYPNAGHRPVELADAAPNLADVRPDHGQAVRPVVATGWDGRSNPVYAYADQLKLPRHLREGVDYRTVTSDKRYDASIAAERGENAPAIPFGTVR